MIISTFKGLRGVFKSVILTKFAKAILNVRK